jgi:hypothetical protein
VDSVTARAVCDLDAAGLGGKAVIAVVETLSTLGGKTELFVETHRVVAGRTDLRRDVKFRDGGIRVFWSENLVLTMAIRAHRGVFVARHECGAVNASLIFRSNRGMALRARIRNIKLIHPRRRIATFFHLMAAMAIDTIGSPPISIFEGDTVNALLVQHDKVRCWSIRGSLLVLYMARYADLFLSDFELRGIRSSFYSSNVLGMAGNTRRRIEITREECLPMSRCQIFFFLGRMTLTATLNDV